MRVAAVQLLGVLLLCDSTAAASPGIRAAAGIAVERGERPDGFYGFGIVELGAAWTRADVHVGLGRAWFKGEEDDGVATEIAAGGRVNVHCGEHVCGALGLDAGWSRISWHLRGETNNIVTNDVLVEPKVVLAIHLPALWDVALGVGPRVAWGREKNRDGWGNTELGWSATALLAKRW